MKILHASIDPMSPASVKRLAATMLCFEHGALAVGPDLAPLPAPHRPWPTVTIPPVTDAGLPVEVHWRPAVGVVFFTPAERLAVGMLVKRVAAALDRAGDEHLRCCARAVVATTSAVIRHRGRVVGGHRQTAGKTALTKVGPGGLVDVPARLFHWTLKADGRLPPHYSARAGFTWVFLPVAMAVEGQTPHGFSGGISSVAEANAAIASVVYDAGGAFRHLADGLEVQRPLALSDFNLPQMPVGVSLSAVRSFASLTYRELANSNVSLADNALPRALLLIDVRAGTVELVGDYRYFAGEAARNRGDVDMLPPCATEPVLAVPAAPVLVPAAQVPARVPAQAGATNPLRRYCCANCCAPVAGAAAVLTDPADPIAHRRRREHEPEPARTSILPDKNSVLICRWCWACLGATHCVTHLRAAVGQWRPPATQAEICVAFPGLAGLAPILAGRPERVAGMAGAFVVRTASGPVILAGASEGPISVLTSAQARTLAMPVADRLRIATPH